MSESPQHHTIICEEVFDENSLPSEEEVLDYATKIGINPKNEPHLLPIALNGLMQPLPEKWKPCFDSDLQKWYYYNCETKASQWEHPLDSVYRQIVHRGRSEGYSSAGDEDSKTFGKEDLKSFEEVSDILSSKSVDPKKEGGEETNMALKERGGSLRGAPLLLRRKQLQSGHDPLQVAKLINTTLRQSLPGGELRADSLTSAGGPLRRSQTSDVLSSQPPPIRGILRESSFSGGVGTGRNSRLSPLQGDHTISHQDSTEEKRSVRFADFEKKVLDIKFELTPTDSEESYSEVDDDESTSGSPEFPQKDNDGGKGFKIEMKPKTTENSMSRPMKTSSQIQPTRGPRKFTVTPVKDDVPSFGLQVTELKSLFQSDSVGPLETNESSESSVGNGKSKEGSAVLGAGVVGGTESEETVITVRKMEAGSSLKRSPGRMDMKSVVEEAGVRGEASTVDLSEYASASSLLMGVPQKGESRKESASLEETQARMAVLTRQKEERLKLFKEELKKQEEEENIKLKNNFDDKLAKLKSTLEKEYEKTEEELRLKYKIDIENFSNKLETEKEKEFQNLRLKFDNLLKEKQEEEEEKLRKEKVKLESESFESLLKIKTEIKSKIEQIRAEEEIQIEEVKASCDKNLETVRLCFEKQKKELEAKQQNTLKEIENNYKKKLEKLKAEKESESIRIAAEWEDQLTALTLGHRSSLEEAQKDHEAKLARLRAEWEREEAEVRKRKATVVQQQDIDYEKLRCEKRLLEDKYRSLKEKYVQLKNDMKVAVERKLQARARRKREEAEKQSSDLKADKGTNDNNNAEPVYQQQQHHHHQQQVCPPPRLTLGEVSPRDLTDLSSDEQFTLSSTIPSNRGEHGRRGRPRKRDDSTSPISTSDEPRLTRGPASPSHFLGLPDFDYYSKRLQVEEDALRVGRDCTDEPARVKDNNNHLIINPHQQERDLSEMEVSLHRTRALLGEKMIRLRLLGQTLARLVDEAAPPGTGSPSGHGGDVITSNNVLQNLDNINSEIREIWNQLNKNQNQAPGGTESGACCPGLRGMPRPGSTVRPLGGGRRPELEARVQGLKEWLDGQRPGPPQSPLTL